MFPHYKIVTTQLSHFIYIHTGQKVVITVSIVILLCGRDLISFSVGIIL